MGVKSIARLGFVLLAALGFSILAQAQEPTIALTQLQQIEAIQTVLVDTLSNIEVSNVDQSASARANRLSLGKGYLTKKLLSSTDSQTDKTYSQASLLLSGLTLLNQKNCKLVVREHTNDKISGRRFEVPFGYDQVANAVGVRFEEQSDESYKFVEVFSENPDTTKIIVSYPDFDELQFAAQGMSIQANENSKTPTGNPSHTSGIGYASSDASVFAVAAWGARADYSARCFKK